MLSKITLFLAVLTVVATDSGNVTTTSPAPANATTTTAPQNITETTTSVSTTSVVTSSTTSVNATTSPAETTTPTSTTTTVAPMSTTTSRPADSTWFVKGYLCKLTLLKEINIRYTVCSDKKSNDTAVAAGKSGN